MKTCFDNVDLEKFLEELSQSSNISIEELKKKLFPILTKMLDDYRDEIEDVPSFTNATWFYGDVQ